ncbi:phage/plasmid primase, P4 family [Rhodococcus pyridinivorans]|uniref:phage/plasmid primase, P4 family n=1 Tax=Rhodococcus pyridinivorans TaxID=103816 RepID=UPI001E32D158|nr:phage/plasmid primase, P4 family [Rhodococcus pyridinivorans]MCD5419100.1 phage/plasmid primase, P4 family [Rhodococcus pyridinivorans]
MNNTSTSTRHATRNGSGSVRAEENTTENVREIKSADPFASTAAEYLRKGWAGPIPLPAKKKASPPTRWTGRNAPYADHDQIDSWLGEQKWKRANIGLRMGTVEVDGKTFEVLGIDVDHYEDVDAEGNPVQKRGYDELIALQKRLGKLPATWTSSARTDGKSGTRFFLVPAGLKWPGKIGSNIDIVQVVHRYSMVYPSYHPTQGQCEWYRPGDKPDGTHTTPYAMTTTPVEGGNLVKLAPGEDVKIPDARTLPLLPKKWVAELTRGIVDEGQPADMVSSRAQIDAWAAENLPSEDEPCSATTTALERHKVAIEADPSSHDKITAGHWELLRLAMEGHHGWQAATSELDTFWRVNVVKRGKRGPQGAAREVFRSRTNALRKIKGEVDEAAQRGINLLAREDLCLNDDDVQYSGVCPTGKAKNPDEYPANDRGNAEHLIDLYGGDVRYVDVLGQWIFWNGTRWHQGRSVGPRCYDAVRIRQEAYAVKLWRLARASGDVKGPEAKAANAMDERAKRSGNVTTVKTSLEAASYIDGVEVKATEFDANPRLLAVENGVIELTAAGAHLRDAVREDLAVYNTGVPYIPLAEQAAEGSEYRHGFRLLLSYLDTFLPDMKLRRFTQKALGYCLLGRNPERLAIFLYGGTSTGKSTMLEAVMEALGDYAADVDTRKLMGYKELNPALAAALPRRVVTASELGDGQLSAEAFKRVTGNERVSAEMKGSNEIVSRVPAFTPVFATNKPPVIQGADEATRKRVLVIPFNRSVADTKDDDKLAAAELSLSGKAAVLAWLVDGWVLYAKEGLPRDEWPTVVRSETDEFNSQMGELSEFIEDCLESVDGCLTPTADLHDAYMTWCARAGVPDAQRKDRAVFAREFRAATGCETRSERLTKGSRNKTRCMVGFTIVVGKGKISPNEIDR